MFATIKSTLLKKISSILSVAMEKVQNVTEMMMVTIGQVIWEIYMILMLIMRFLKRERKELML